MRRLRRAAACTVIAALAPLLAATPAGARSGPSTSVVLALRPTSEVALHALASTTQRLTRSQRAARLAELVPGRTRHAEVAAVARALGLTVRATSPWSVRVAGSPATVAALFGTAPRPAGAAGRAYTRLPAALAPLVVAALPTSGRVARPLATTAARTGSDLRATYAAPAGSTGAGTTVATVQLSGWRKADLTTYAQRHGITGFDASTQYAGIAIDGAKPDTSDGNAGDEEVALDQEAILAAAPGAGQRAYFAPNTDGGAGYIDAIHAVGADAASHHIVALSLSWGGCEASNSPTWMRAMDQALAYTLAAGVTIFAASGDAGSTDCLDTIRGDAQFAPAVDFPASSPYVVGVGGVVPGSAGALLGWNGSGGGESTFEALPSWQNGVASRSRTGHRLVPDIASDADPEHGLCVYDSAASEPTTGCTAPEFMLGGTSLASPTQAALLADTLSALGYTAGIGDIHPALYAGAGTAAIRDVIADEYPADGNGDFHAGTGFDLVTGLGAPNWTALEQWLGQFDMGGPRYARGLTVAIRPHAPSAAVAYSGWAPATIGAPADCAAATSASPPSSVTFPPATKDGTYRYWAAGVANVPGSGSCHIGSTVVTIDRQAPKVTASIQVTTAGTARAQWGFADASPSSGLAKFVVSMVAGGKTQWTVTTTARSRTFNALPQTRWHLTVVGYDNAGNSGRALAHLYDDGTFSYGTHWARTRAAAAYRGSFMHSAVAGAHATMAGIVGRTFVLYVRKCSSCGKVGVYDDHGHLLSTVDTYSSSTHYRVVVTVLSLPASAKRTLVFRVLPSKNRASHGHDVELDALAVGT